MLSPTTSTQRLDAARCTFTRPAMDNASLSEIAAHTPATRAMCDRVVITGGRGS